MGKSENLDEPPCPFDINPSYAIGDFFYQFSRLRRGHSLVFAMRVCAGERVVKTYPLAIDSHILRSLLSSRWITRRHLCFCDDGSGSAGSPNLAAPLLDAAQRVMVWVGHGCLQFQLIVWASASS